MRRLLAAALLAAVPGAGAAEGIATFAGGCFWCTEADFEKLPGVTSAVSGYIGGHVSNPGYEAVSAGGTGHTEAVEIRYDAAKISYAQLLRAYWRSIDPTVKDRQFCDAGAQYRTAIFVHDAEQRRLAEATKGEVATQLNTTIHTQIADAGKFYPAEEYHQDYYRKNPLRYRFYRSGCGRDERLQQIWGTAAAH